MPPLSKQSITINFSQGLDLKTDPFQVQAGKFLALSDSVFDKGGLLQKRNGYGELPVPTNSQSTYLTTFNDNLMAVGTEFQSFSSASQSWVNKGLFQSINLSVKSLVRTDTNQIQVDSVISSSGLVCTVFTDNEPVAGVIQPFYKYVISDVNTGENVVNSTLISVVGGVVAGSPRVFLLKSSFIIVFTINVSGLYHLQYIAISIADPTQVTTNIDITSQYAPSSGLSFDGVAVSNNLYLVWNGSDTGGAIRACFITSSLQQSNTIVWPNHTATLMSVCADTEQGTPVIYASFYDSISQNGYSLAFDINLLSVLAPTQTITGEVVANITSAASGNICDFFYEIINSYGYDNAIATNYIKSNQITVLGGVGSPIIIRRSVGLASKAFIYSNSVFFLTIYNSVYQPTYFLLNSSGSVVAKLAYSNGSAYYTLGLPGVSMMGNIAQVPYLIKDQIQAVNKTQGAANASGVYSQTGLNLASFTLGTSNLTSSEIGGDLHVSGGFLWMYDGALPVEHGFFLWPDYIETSTSTTGGSMTAQIYYYAATYEWSDNQGNLFRSAPSIPVIADLSASMTSTNKVSVHVPTLRLTHKIQNPLKLVLYRWSTAQQTYYQITSISNPVLNQTSTDYITIVDKLADSSIIGNNILYTTGGVLENIAAPALDSMTLFQSRLFLIDSEDKNLLWFSKQVIESTPVEMSDLLTIFVAPTTSVQGSTGPMTALSAMDDKLIIFKRNAIYYINGQGPDNTGANSQFSEPIFITSVVGCNDQRSIVLMPNGIMFQSDKGIWLLGRDLSTQYIGAPVESLTQGAFVLSAVSVPATNQVRFHLDSGATLMYDYYYGQWGTFNNVSAVSSTIYQNLHTYLNPSGNILQETPGKYLDVLEPVSRSFTTSWINVAGLQGYERAYFFYLLGVFLSPHKLVVSIAYDYDPTPTQQTIFMPDNYTPSWGGLPLWGSSPQYGGGSSVETGRIFLQKQKCESFQLTIRELYDPSFGIPPGAGFTLSGLNLILGTKSNYPRRLGPSRSFG